MLVYMCCLNRQEVSALRADFVRRQAEEEAYYTQQVGWLCSFSKFTKSRFYCSVGCWLAHTVYLYMKHRLCMETK